jgi:hypothetical protein
VETADDGLVSFATGVPLNRLDGCVGVYRVLPANFVKSIVRGPLVLLTLGLFVSVMAEEGIVGIFTIVFVFLSTPKCCTDIRPFLLLAKGATFVLIIFPIKAFLSALAFKVLLLTV